LQCFFVLLFRGELVVIGLRRQRLPKRSEFSINQAFSTCPSRHLQGCPFLNILLCAGGSAQKWDLSDWARLLPPKPLGDYNSQISAQILTAVQKVHIRAVDLDRPSLPCGLRCVPFFTTAKIVATGSLA